jgi:hypothetical protein
MRWGAPDNLNKVDPGTGGKLAFQRHSLIKGRNSTANELPFYNQDSISRKIAGAKKALPTTQVGSYLLEAEEWREARLSILFLGLGAI